LATVIYCLGYIQAAEVRRQFEALYQFLLHKWWFDELYDVLFVRPTHAVARWAAAVDRHWIDGLIDGLARWTSGLAAIWDRMADQWLVDGSVNRFASGVYGVGVWLRRVQTGRLRQYVMFVAIGALAVFVFISFFWGSSWAG